MIGRTGIRTFPAEELCGVIFVFVGDEDFDTPPLKHDIPNQIDKNEKLRTPRLQDDDALALSIHRDCIGDWRLAAESGGDPGHIMIHRKSALVLSLDTALSLGEPVTGADFLRIWDED